MDAKRLWGLGGGLRTALIAGSVAALVGAGGGFAASSAYITGAQVKNGSLKGADIRNGSLTGADIKNRSIGIRDLSPAAVRQLRGKPGPSGPPGLAGPQGAAGGFDPAKTQTVIGPEVYVPAGGLEFNINAYCPPGTAVLGGGFFSNIAKASRSAPTPGGWNVFVYNDTTADVTAQAYVVCGLP